jgi:nickel-dependent lactate racemase
VDFPPSVEFKEVVSHEISQQPVTKMINSQAIQPPGRLLSEQEILHTLHASLEGKFSHQKVLVLIPDHTRSLPLPFLFRAIIEILHDTKQLDFMVALGTHPPLPETSLCDLVGITSDERVTIFKGIGLFNHAWEDPLEITSLGRMDGDEIKVIAGSSWHPTLPEKVEILINNSALDHDHILILAPIFPHEVAGFSGGAKYLFPGISGPDMIHATHWLGALSGVVGTIGLKDTPVRRMIHAATSRLKTPVTLAALIVEGRDLSGLFIGDLYESWSAAVELSAQRHIHWCHEPYQQVLSCAPTMYDELWTAAKAMYKIEPAVAIGGEVIIFAPHLQIVSRVHGKYIYDIGYHILPYFLSNWARYKDIPLGILAHATHLRGSGVIESGVEKPNVHISLASRIPSEDCARLNLGYVDPAKIVLEDWKDREEEGILFVPKAGEILYRLYPGENQKKMEPAHEKS